MLIDYFIRYLYSKAISSKYLNKIVKFLENVYRKLDFMSIITVNGKEVNNSKVQE